MHREETKIDTYDFLDVFPVMKGVLFVTRFEVLTVRLGQLEWD